MGIVDYSPEHQQALEEFNRRLRAKNVDFQLAPPPPETVSAAAGERFSSRLRLALEGDAVRGGYSLVRHDAALRGRLVAIHFLQLPISEGIIDPRYARVGLDIIQDAWRNAPLLYALGMGGMNRPLPRLLARFGFQPRPIPFFFRVFRPAAFLRSIRPVRSSRLRRAVLDTLAATGIGAPPILGAHAWLGRHGPRGGEYSAEEVTDWGAWAQDVWSAAAPHYSFLMLRDADALTVRFPAGDRRLHRLRVRRAGQEVGWAVVTDSRFEDDKYFGDMRVGALADCLAAPGSETLVVAAATTCLRDRQVDLVVSNQSSGRWSLAMKRNGYLEAASNYVLAASPRLAEMISPAGTQDDEMHVNRGDGDGPIHL